MNQSVTIDVSKAQAVMPASRLTVWQRRLTILLAAQLLLIIGVFAFHQNSRVQVSAEPLLGISPADVDRVVIQDPNNKVTLQKLGDTWQLPELHQLPVDKQTLESLLEKLEGIKLTWPVTTTASSHERFEVTGTQFQRRIELFQGDTKKTDFWLGTSPGFKKIHIRREGENEVYAVELTAFEFAPAATDWLQKDLLAVKDVNSIKTDDYEIQKSGDSWAFTGSNPDANQVVDAAKATELVNAVANLQVQAPVTDAPQSVARKITVRSAAGEFHYEFMQEGHDYFVKRSDQDRYFKLSQYEYDRIVAVTKADLLTTASASAVDPLSQVVNQAIEPIFNNVKDK